MNLECKVPSKTPMAILQAIDQGLSDLEYWSPCELSGLLARNWVKRTEAPYGGYYLEVTDEGFKALALAERIEATGAIA